ncbi:SGNH/GDSL hydrolase family protein [Parvularcula sp. IMCC14364]|uniref:SGNH/GDSL hydrolase family protein n=1 Tax=Parvularcula sp. IMCC14364 TaxID=3067902 RepID=UPI0027424DB5|nr:SGNH/GDSL hydrolase family protein [Parvularcula sp. IMCC14364]
MQKPFHISILCILVIGYALIFAETFLRLLAPQAIIPRHVTAAPYGIRMNVPGADYAQVTPETRVSIRINEQGLRAELSYPLEKPHGVTRVALFGDSYFMGYESDLQDSFAWQLEQALRAERCPVEVLNFAVSGFGTAEMLRTLESKGLSFTPDIVLFQWHHTDPADNLRAGLYAYQAGQLQETGAAYMPAIRTRQLLERMPLYKSVSENSHLYAATREKAATFIKHTLTGGALVNTAVTAVSKEVTMLDQPDRPDASPLDVALLTHAEQVATQNDAAFFVVDIPSFHTRTSFSSAFRLLPAQLVAQPHFISPVDSFRQAARPDTKLYWEQGHYHLTPTGNRLLAQVVADRLLARSARQLACANSQ